jgi:hypothetical protein
VAEIQRPDPHLTVLPRREGDVRRVIDRGRQDGAAVALVVVGKSVPPPTKLIRRGALARIVSAVMGSQVWAGCQRATSRGKRAYGRSPQATNRTRRRRCCSVRPPHTP